MAYPFSKVGRVSPLPILWRNRRGKRGGAGVDAPDVTVNAPTNSDKTFTGTAPAGATVTVSNDNFTTIAGTAKADTSGRWSYTFASPQTGITVSVRAAVQAEIRVPGELARALAYRGINFAGMEYGDPAVNDPDVTGGWNRPTNESFPYYATRGFNLVRIPYKIERCQPGGPGTALGSDTKSAAYLATLIDLGNRARAAGMTVMWDAHNYAKIRTAASGWATDFYVGSEQFPVSALADFHVKFAQYAGLVLPADQIDLMNEPTTSLEYNGLQVVTDQIAWVNACISALRSAGKTNLIHVPGMSYSSASGWSYHGTDKLAAGIVDPGNNWVLQLHQYTDQNQSGSQDNTFYGIWYGKLLRAAREGALKFGYRLFLGEFNATYSTNSSQATVNAGRNAIHECMQELIAYPSIWLGFAGWRGGGRIDGNDITTLDQWSGGWTSPNSDLVPTDGAERDKLTIIKRYTGPKVADLPGSSIDLDLARVAYKGGNPDLLLPVSRGSRPGMQEDGQRLVFAPNILRRTRRGVEIAAPVIDDNLILTQDLTDPRWTKAGTARISAYTDPANGRTYTRLQMSGNYENYISYNLAHAAGRQSMEIMSNGPNNQYVAFYSGSGDYSANITSVLNDNPRYPPREWFRWSAPLNQDAPFRLFNRNVDTDILIRNLKVNVGETATPWTDASYDGDQVDFAGALLDGIAVGDFTLVIQTRDLNTAGVVLPILGGVVDSTSVSLLTREADGALSTGLGGALKTGTQALIQWGVYGGDFGSRRVALSVRRSGTPRVAIGATGTASVGANQAAGAISAATLGRLGDAYLGGLIERVTLFPGFRDTAALNALVA